MKVRSVLLIAGAALAIASPASSAPKAAYGTWGVEMKDMDPGVKPGDDFFAYAEGTWLKTTRFPPTRPAPATITSCRTTSSFRSGRWSRT